MSAAFEETAFQELMSLVRELRALEHVDAVAGWDQETYMPPKGADVRAEGRAAIRGVLHEKLVSARLGELAESLSVDASLTDSQRAAARVVKRDRDREVKLPARLVTELARAQGLGVEAWKVAKKNDDYAHFAPFLDRLLVLRREQADALGHGGERYDALLEGFEPGMTVARLDPVLGRLREKLVPIVAETAVDVVPESDAFLHADLWDVDRQWDFSTMLIRAMGFDLDAGRLDRSAHPFCSGFAPTDVRLTTRLFRNDGASALFSALHEAGHGLYEQGLPDPLGPLGVAASMGLHESQSRLWENLVGRSRPFWSRFFPEFARLFPEALAGVSLDRWLAAIRRPRRSLIRVEADEVTYNLHVLVRYELELQLLRGSLTVADLPAAWNETYARVVGVRPANDATGVLQDIHWAWGELGYFPTYTLGNMYAATLFKAAKRALPGLDESIGRGELLPLREWLRTTVHARGRSVDAEEIVRDATGTGLVETDLVEHLSSVAAGNR